jgi:quinol monooxygenase YgiN
MSELVFVDTSEVRKGKLEELKTAISGLAEFVRANEPGPILYNVYLTEDGTRMTVIQAHPDSASMEYHMKVAGPTFTKFVDLIKMSSMDVYGAPSVQLREQMRQKAVMLGAGGLTVHEFAGGFARLGTS